MESKKFYTETPGLKVKFDFSDRGLLAFNVGEEEPAIILKDQSTFPDAKPSIMFTVENAEETAKELLSKGVKLTKSPYKIVTGSVASLLIRPVTCSVLPTTGNNDLHPRFSIEFD